MKVKLLEFKSLQVITAAILSENRYMLQVRYEPHLSDKARYSEASRFSITKIWYAYAAYHSVHAHMARSHRFRLTPVSRPQPQSSCYKTANRAPRSTTTIFYRYPYAGKLVTCQQQFPQLHHVLKHRGYRSGMYAGLPYTVLISKICPYFAVLRLRKYYCPCY